MQPLWYCFLTPVIKLREAGTGQIDTAPRSDKHFVLYLKAKPDSELLAAPFQARRLTVPIDFAARKWI